MWVIVISICVCVTTVMSLAFCLCWGKKSKPKNEWQGLDGMVTQKNPDENVNHLPFNAAASCAVDGVVLKASSVGGGDTSDSSSKRNVVSTTNTRRSLPDIPLDPMIAVNWEPTGVGVGGAGGGDNSSEHYATVGQYQNAKRHTIANSVDVAASTTTARPSISQHSSISQADDAFSPYERVKYDKIKSQQEHPYAQLQPTTSRQIVVEERNSNNCIPEERTSLLRADGPEPAAPPRSRRSSNHSGLLTVDDIIIPAASAVAGGIAASPELPYMTPPVIQSNFSGDSQDSSKGYTSISVREPLANILAQTKNELRKKQRNELDPHYSTVSDDSDDVYTTIPDTNLNQMYTTTTTTTNDDDDSGTYAHIPGAGGAPITVEADINPTPSGNLTGGGGGNDDDDGDDDGMTDELYEAPPVASSSSVDGVIKPASTSHYSHSRQASSSSSIANVGSPKPEKRQANSPLPPPPPAASNFDLHLDSNVQVVQPAAGAAVPATTTAQRNLDDLYAKVHKNNKQQTIIKKDDFSDSVIKATNNNLSDNRKTTSRSCNSINDDHNKQIVVKVDNKRHQQKGKYEHDYETLRKSTSTGGNGDNCSDPGYERIRKRSNHEPEEPGYASINGPDSMTSSSDPGYEVLKQRTPPPMRLTTAEECDPNYEELRHRLSNASSDCSAGYTKIVKKTQQEDEESLKTKKNISYGGNSHPELDEEDDEPNYESMPSESLPGCKLSNGGNGNGSESDPNYESVNHLIAGSSELNHREEEDEEPPYELLLQHDIVDDNSSGRIEGRKVRYEKVDDTSESSNGDSSGGGRQLGLPPYEKLLASDSDSFNKDSSTPPSPAAGAGVPASAGSVGKNSRGGFLTVVDSKKRNYINNSTSSGSSSVEETNSDLHEDDAIFQV